MACGPVPLCHRARRDQSASKRDDQIETVHSEVFSRVATS